MPAWSPSLLFAMVFSGARMRILLTLVALGLLGLGFLLRRKKA